LINFKTTNVARRWRRPSFGRAQVSRARAKAAAKERERGVALAIIVVRLQGRRPCVCSCPRSSLTASVPYSTGGQTGAQTQASPMEVAHSRLDLVQRSSLVSILAPSYLVRGRYALAPGCRLWPLAETIDLLRANMALSLGARSLPPPLLLFPMAARSFVRSFIHSAGW